MIQINDSDKTELQYEIIKEVESLREKNADLLVENR